MKAKLAVSMLPQSTQLIYKSNMVICFRFYIYDFHFYFIVTIGPNGHNATTKTQILDLTRIVFVIIYKYMQNEIVFVNEILIICYESY